MKKNVASQVVSAVVVSATDGSAVTASVSVTVTGDAGTQGAGGGTLVHEGGGEWSYVPTQAETNFDHIMFKFSATGAIPVGIQVYTDFPQTGDSFARLGAPAGASTAADIAAIQSDTNDIQTRLPAALTAGGNMKSDALAWAGAATATTDVALETAPTNFAALAVTAGGAVTVGTNNDKTGYGLSAAAVQAIWDALTAALTTVGSIGKLLVDRIDAAISSRGTGTALDAAGVRSAVGLSSANLDTQLADIPTVAEFEARTIASAAADKLEQGATALVTSTCAAGSTTTSIVTNLTEATNDHFNGRVITFTSGALAGQSTSITDYDGTTKTITCPALTEAPANTDAFVIS